jgi:hypothetical protein
MRNGGRHGQLPFPTKWKHGKPPLIEEFVETFRDDYASAEYLAKK